MKTKLLFCAMLVIAIMSSCKKDYDVMGTMKDVANKTVRTTYVNWSVDSTAMKSVMSQYVYPANGNEGAFQVASAGNGLPIATSQEKVIWEDKGFTEGNLTTWLTATHESGLVNNFLFAHMNLLDESGTLYNSSLLDIYKTYSQVYDEFVPLKGMWMYKDTTRYIDTTKVTLDYLKWSEQTSKNITKDSVDKLIAFVGQQWVQDTLHWYNKEFGTSIRDTVYYKATKSDPNLYNAISAVPSPASRVVEMYDTVGVATQDLIKFQFVCDEQGNQTGMMYSLTEAYDRAFYEKPDTTAITATVMETSMPAAVWCMSYLTNAKKFDMLLKGDETITTKAFSGGNWVPVVEPEKDAYRGISISAFDKKKLTLTFGEVKMALEEVE